MKIKRIMSEVKLVIADLEVELNGALRSSPTLCALIENADGAPPSVVPLNTADFHEAGKRDTAVILIPA